MHSAVVYMLAQSLCPSISLSNTVRHCVKTAEHIVEILSTPDSQMILVPELIAVTKL